MTETKSEVKLQGVLDHIAQILVLSGQYSFMSKITDSDFDHNNYSFRLTYKWGLDGSSGYSLYKQKFRDGNAETSNAHILLTSVVSLQLMAEHQHSGQKVELWKNSRTSSTRWCRPIRFQFVHENSENTKEENAYIEQQITQLSPTPVSFGDTQILLFIIRC